MLSLILSVDVVLDVRIIIIAMHTRFTQVTHGCCCCFTLCVRLIQTDLVVDVVVAAERRGETRKNDSYRQCHIMPHNQPNIPIIESRRRRLRCCHTRYYQYTRTDTRLLLLSSGRPTKKRYVCVFVCVRACVMCVYLCLHSALARENNTQHARLGGSRQTGEGEGFHCDTCGWLERFCVKVTKRKLCAT